MHKRARGHEAEPVTPIFLCPKTKRSKTREKGATGESHAQTCKRSRGRACNSHFFMSKNEKEKRGRKAQLGRVMHQRAKGHETEPVTPIFLCPKTKKKNEGERRNWREHARRCKRTRDRAQSLPFFMLNNRKKLQSENTGALYATL